MGPKKSFSEESINEETSSIISGDISGDGHTTSEDISFYSDDISPKDINLEEIYSPVDEIRLDALSQLCINAIDDEDIAITPQVLVAFIKEFKKNSSTELNENPSDEEILVQERLIKKQTDFRDQFRRLLSNRVDLIQTIFSSETLGLLSAEKSADETQLANILYLIYSRLEKKVRNDSQLFNQLAENLEAHPTILHEFNRKILTQFFNQKNSLASDEFTKKSQFSPSLATAAWNSGIGSQQKKGNDYLFKEYCTFLNEEYTQRFKSKNVDVKQLTEELQDSAQQLAKRLADASPEEFIILAKQLEENIKHPLWREIYKESLKISGMAEKFIFTPETLYLLSTDLSTGSKKNYATRAARIIAAVETYKQKNDEPNPTAIKKLAHDLLTSFFHEPEKINTILTTLKTYSKNNMFGANKYSKSNEFGRILEKEMGNLLSISLLLDGPEWHLYHQPENINNLAHKPAIVLAEGSTRDLYKIQLVFLNNKTVTLNHEITISEISSDFLIGRDLSSGFINLTQAKQNRTDLTTEQERQIFENTFKNTLNQTIDEIKAFVIQDLEESKIDLVENPISLLKNLKKAKELEKKLWFDKGRNLLESQGSNPEEIKACFEKALNISEHSSPIQDSRRTSMRASMISSRASVNLSNQKSDSIDDVAEMIGKKSNKFNWTTQSLKGIISVLINTELPKDENLWAFFSNLEEEISLYSPKERAFLIENLLIRLFSLPESEKSYIHNTVWSRAMQFAAEQLKVLEVSDSEQQQIKAKINHLLLAVNSNESSIFNEFDKFSGLIELFKTKPITHLEKTAFFLTEDTNIENAARNMGQLLNQLSPTQRNDSINFLVAAFITNPEESETRQNAAFLVAMLKNSEVTLDIKQEIIFAIPRQMKEISDSKQISSQIQHENFCALFLDEVIRNSLEPDIAKIILINLSLDSVDWKLPINNNLSKSAIFILNVINSFKDDNIDTAILTHIMSGLNTQSSMLRAEILGNIFKAKPAIILLALTKCKVDHFRQDEIVRLLQLFFENTTQNQVAGTVYRSTLETLIFSQIKKLFPQNVSVFTEKLKEWPEIVEKNLIDLLKDENQSQFQHLLTLLSKEQQKEVQSYWIKTFTTLPKNALTGFAYTDQIELLSSVNSSEKKQAIIAHLLQDKSIYKPLELSNVLFRKLLDADKKSTEIIQTLLKSNALIQEKNAIYFRILQLVSTANVNTSDQARAYISPLSNRINQAVTLLQETSEETKNNFKLLIFGSESTKAGSMAIKQYLSRTILASQVNQTFPPESFGREYLASLDFWFLYPDKHAGAYVSSLSALEKLMAQLSQEEQIHLLQEAKNRINELKTLDLKHLQDIFICYMKQAQKNPALLESLSELLITYFLDENHKNLSAVSEILKLLESFDNKFISQILLSLKDKAGLHDLLSPEKIDHVADVSDQHLDQWLAILSNEDKKIILLNLIPDPENTETENPNNQRVRKRIWVQQLDNLANSLKKLPYMSDTESKVCIKDCIHFTSIVNSEDLINARNNPDTSRFFSEFFQRLKQTTTLEKFINNFNSSIAQEQTQEYIYSLCVALPANSMTGEFLKNWFLKAPYSFNQELGSQQLGILQFVSSEWVDNTIKIDFLKSVLNTNSNSHEEKLEEKRKEKLIKNPTIEKLFIELTNNNSDIFTVIKILNDQQRKIILENIDIMRKLNTETVDMLLETFADPKKRTTLCQETLLSDIFETYPDLNQYKLSFMPYVPFDALKKNFDKITGGSNPSLSLSKIINFFLGLLTNKEADQKLSTLFEEKISSMDDTEFTRWERFYDIVKNNKPFWLDAETVLKISENTLPMVLKNLSNTDMGMDKLFNEMNDPESSFQKNPAGKIRLSLAIIQYATEQLNKQYDAKIQQYLDNAFEILLDGMDAWIKNGFTPPLPETISLPLLQLFDNRLAVYNNLYDETIKKTQQQDEREYGLLLLPAFQEIEKVNIPSNFSAGYVIHIAKNPNENDQLYYFDAAKEPSLIPIAVKPEYQKKFNEIVTYKKITEIEHDILSKENLDEIEKYTDHTREDLTPIREALKGLHQQYATIEKIIPFHGELFLTIFSKELDYPNLSQQEAKDYWHLCNQMLNFKVLEVKNKVTGENQGSLIEQPIYALVTMLLHSKFANNDQRWIEFQNFFDTIRLKGTTNHPLAIEGLATGLNSLLNFPEKEIEQFIATIPLESLDWILRQVITENLVNPEIISALMYRYTISILSQESIAQAADLFEKINTSTGRQGVYDALLNQPPNTPFPSAICAFMIRNMAKDNGGKIPQGVAVKLFGTLFQLPDSIDDNNWKKQVENALKGLTGQDREAALPIFQAIFQYYSHQITDDRNIRDKFIQTADTIALFFNENIENILKTCPDELKVSFLNDELSGLNVHRDIKYHRHEFQYIDQYCIDHKKNDNIPSDNSRALSSKDICHIIYSEDTQQWTIMGYAVNQMDSGQPAVVEYHVTFPTDESTPLLIKSLDSDNPEATLGESMIEHLNQLAEEIRKIERPDNAEIKRCVENTLPSPCKARRERAERFVNGFTRNIADLDDTNPLKQGIIQAIVRNNALNKINHLSGLTVVENLVAETTEVSSINAEDSGKTGTPLDKLRLDFVTLKTWLTSPKNVASLETNAEIKFSDIVNALRARAPFLVKFGKDVAKKKRKELEQQLNALPSDSKQRNELIAQIERTKITEKNANQFSGDEFLVAVINDLRRNITDVAQTDSYTAKQANSVLSDYICQEFQSQSTTKNMSEWISRGLENTARWMIGGDVAQCESILSHLLPKQSLNVAKVWEKEKENQIDPETELYVRQNGQLIKIAAVKKTISAESNSIDSQSNIRQYELKWLDNTIKEASEYYQAIGERERLFGKKDDIQTLIDLNPNLINPFHSVYGHLPTALETINSQIIERTQRITELEESVKNQSIHLQEGTALYDKKGNYLGSLSEQFHLSQDILYGKKTWYNILLDQPISQWETTGDTIYIPILDVINRELLSDFYKDIEDSQITPKEKANFLRNKIFKAIFTGKPALSTKDCEQLVKYSVSNDILMLFKQYDRNNDPSGSTRRALLRAMLLSPAHMSYFMESEEKQLQLWEYLNLCQFDKQEMYNNLLIVLKNKIPFCPYAEVLSQVVRAAYFKAHGVGAESEEFRMEHLSLHIIKKLPSPVKKHLFAVPENFHCLQQETYFEALRKDLSDDELKQLFRDFLKKGFHTQHTYKKSMYTTKGLLAFYRGLGEDVFWEVFNTEVPLNSPQRNLWITQGIFGNAAFMQALSEDLGTNSLMKLIAHDISHLPENLGIREKTPDRYMSFSMDEIIELIKYYQENPSEELQDFLADWLFLQLQSGQWIKDDTTSTDSDEFYLNSLTWDPDNEGIELTTKTNAHKMARLSDQQLAILNSLAGNEAFKKAMTTKYPLSKSNLEALIQKKAEKNPNDFNTFYDEKEDGKTTFIPDAANLKISLSLKGAWNNRAWVSVKAIDYALLESARQMDNAQDPKKWKAVLHDYIGTIREPWNKNNKNKTGDLTTISQQLSEIRTTVLRLLSTGGKIGHSSEDTLNVLLDRRNFLLLMEMYDNSNNDEIKEEVRTILLAMFVTNPQIFLSSLSQFDRKNEWNFAVKLLKELKEMGTGQTNEELKATQAERKTNRSIAIVQNMLGLMCLGGVAGAALAKNTTKGVAIGAGLGAATGAVAGGIHTILGRVFDAAETGVKFLNDTMTAASKGINTDQLNAARNIFKDRDFEMKDECDKRGFMAGYRRIAYYQPQVWFTGFHAIGLYLGFKKEPKSTYGVPSYRESIPSVYIGDKNMTVKGNAIHLIPETKNNTEGYSCYFYHQGQKENQEPIWIAKNSCNRLIKEAGSNTILDASKQQSSSEKATFSTMLQEIENHRNTAILNDESTAKEGYYTSRTYVTPTQTKQATHQAIQQDLSAGEFHHLKKHLSIKPAENDSKTNITNAKASVTSLLAAIRLADLTPGSGSTRVSDKAIYTVPRNWMDRLWHGTTGWFTGKCTIEKNNLQELKAMLNDISQEEETSEQSFIHQVNNIIQKTKQDTHNSIQPNRLNDTHKKKIELLETVINNQTPMMNSLMKELTDAKKMDVFKEKLIAVQSSLMSLVITAMKIKLLMGETAPENPAILTVMQYTKALQTLMEKMKTAHHPSAQKIQDMLTDITFQCSHVSERLLITRLENLEKMLENQTGSIIEKERNTLQKDQWIACKTILEVYPEDTKIREKFNILSGNLKLHPLERTLICELEAPLKSGFYSSHKWLSTQQEFTGEPIGYAMQTDVSIEPKPETEKNEAEIVFSQLGL